MNRNTELHFSQTPSIDIKRSKFEMSHSHKLTMNAAEIVPIYMDCDILPGDTVQMDMAEMIRMATPIYPVADNCYADIYWFFVPHRLCWEHWQAFWGENDDPWTQTNSYEIPQIEAPTGGWTEGTIADYIGVPTKVDGFSVNALPFRAYAKIYNDWFRDENLVSNCHIYLDETTRTGQTGAEQGYSGVTGTELGGKPMKAAKFHDRFTSCLPQPQKGDPVGLPLTGVAPVTTLDTIHTDIGDPLHRVRYGFIDGTDNTRLSNPKVYVGAQSSTIIPGYYYPEANNGEKPLTLSGGQAQNFQGTGLPLVDIQDWAGVNGIAPINLYADLGTATMVTISQLRMAFSLQKYLENAALHGTRYIEYLRGVFGVTSSDARLQRAEYLGGERIPLNMDQIIQTSSTDATSPQGNTAGFSCTLTQQNMFTKSFEEHGTLMCLAVIRTDHTYQQGLPRMLSRKTWTDFYNPFFAHISNQPVYNKEIYLQGRTVVDADGKPYDEQAFGYQEAWSEYRYKENRCSGYMRSNATGSLDVWTYADDYNSMPYLSQEWIEETKDNIDRTIAVTSQLTHQFLADIFFKAYYTRPMPVYSVPGLIDHV